jgi:hypothetical protein
VLVLKRLFEGQGSRSQAVEAVTSSGLEGLEQRTLVAAALLLFEDGAGVAAGMSDRREGSHGSAAVGCAIVSEDDLQCCQNALSIFGDQSIEEVFTDDAEDFTVNVACVARAVQEAAVFSQLRPKLLKPFQGADKMYEVVLVLKRLYEGQGSRSQAVEAVTSSGLEGLEQRTLVAAALLLFEEGGGSISTACDAVRSTHVAPSGSGATSGVASSVAVGLSAVPAPSLPRVQAAGSVSLQAPSDSAMQKLRAAVVSLEDDSLEDLVVSPGTSDAAVTANSATLFIVLKSDADFSKVQPLLTSLLSTFGHIDLVVSFFKSMHCEYHSMNAVQRQLSEVLAEISCSSTGLSECELSTVVNVASLLHQKRRIEASCAAASLPGTELPRVQSTSTDTSQNPDQEVVADVYAAIVAFGVDSVFNGCPDDVCINAACVARAVQEAAVFSQLRPKLLKPFQGAEIGRAHV